MLNDEKSRSKHQHMALNKSRVQSQNFFTIPIARLLKIDMVKCGNNNQAIHSMQIRVLHNESNVHSVHTSDDCIDCYRFSLWWEYKS